MNIGSFKDYLRHFMDSRFDSRWLDTLLAQNEGELLLQKLGATETPYGVISACGRSLYEIASYSMSRKRRSRKRGR